MKTVIEIPSTEALPEACRRFLGAMGNHSIFAFFGEMGAGKTTFISALSRMLGVSSDLAGSPSFSTNTVPTPPAEPSTISTSTASTNPKRLSTWV